ncbi:MAG: hypothetical protein II931_04280 [Clostridia bacterium]|nr:hypothetical protein [Clostridia bacterium]
MNKLKICSLILSLLIAVSGAACNSNNDNQNVQTNDTPIESEVAVEDQDIGEHKDYDK